MAAQFKTVCKFNHLAEIHHTDPVGNMADNTDIMCNEKVGQVHLGLQIFKHIDDLGLYGHIQGGNWLIAYNEFRFDCQCTGDPDALLLAAGKLMWEAVGMLRIQTDLIQKLIDPVAAL